MWYQRTKVQMERNDTYSGYWFIDLLALIKNQSTSHQGITSIGKFTAQPHTINFSILGGYNKISYNMVAN
jgi:hypothetical protein